MNKVRVLAVAPYESMKEVIESVAAARSDVEVTTIVGNMERGAALVQKCDQSRYDVIISRGGTATHVREIASIPVIEIELTPYDIRNAMASVPGAKTRFAVTGFPGIVDAAGTLCDILNIDVKIVPIRNDAEARSVLPELKRDGIELLICDMVGMEAAPAVGMDAVLITSGVKGIEDALNKAVSHFYGVERVKLAAAVYEAELKATGERCVVLKPTGEIVFSSPELSVPPTIRKLLDRMVPSVLADGTLSATRPIGSREYSIRANTIYYRDEQCVLFRLRSEGARLPVNTPGVRFYDSSEEDLTRISRHYGLPGSGLLERAEKIAQSGLAALVCGERGMLTESFAGYICMHGLLSERDCCVVDCAEVSARGWEKLLGHSGLLAFRTGSTVLFEHVSDLSDREITNLIEFIQAADLTRNLRIVFAVTTGVFPQREEALIRQITQQLYAATLELVPLRKRMEDLPAILENCMTFACADMGVRMPEIEPEGREMLMRYSWPRNFPQLYRVTVQLITSCEGDRITAGAVEEVLTREGPGSSGQNDSGQDLELTGTLEEMNCRIVMRVLAEEGMNRTRTAKRLGISRATLWRMLDKEQG